LPIKITFQGFLPEISGFKHADKLTHIIYGAVIGAIAAYIALKVGLPAYIMALTAAAIAAIGKEIYDANKSNGHWDSWDIVATIALPLAALLFSLVC
jgi:ABC-type methionine transport system permease subunit